MPKDHLWYLQKKSELAHKKLKKAIGVLAIIKNIVQDFWNDALEIEEEIKKLEDEEVKGDMAKIDKK